MGKSITFVDKDAQLIKKTVAYQKKEEFPRSLRQFGSCAKKRWNKDEKDYCIGVMRSYAFVAVRLRKKQSGKVCRKVYCIHR